jgi:hypothetical protein
VSERDAEPGELRLFDLPLTPPDDEPGGEAAGTGPEREGARGPARHAAPPPAARPAAAPRAAPGELPLFPPEAPAAPEAAAGRSRAAGGGRPVPASAPPERPAPAPAAGGGPAAGSAHAAPGAFRGPAPAPFGARLVAALADLGVHALAAGIAWAGSALAGARLGLADLPALGVYLLAFSFLYSVVSLAFWGRTPGMAAARVVARGAGGRPLTFGQTGLRWLAGVVTALLAGLPLLLALTGRSAADRLSGSRTFRSR